MATSTQQIHKDMAVDFLRLIIAGDIDAAYERYVDMDGKHHNLFTPAGFPALKKAMFENRYQSPEKQLRVVNALAEGDLAAVQTHLHMEGADVEAVYFFRFKDGKIVELWDCGQALPPDSPNADGAF